MAFPSARTTASNAGKAGLTAQQLESLGRQLLSAGKLEELRWVCAQPDTPEHFLLELCRFPELHDELGHRPGSRKLIETMAEQYRYPESVVTIGLELFEDASRSPEPFEQFLRRHRDNRWLFETFFFKAEPDDPRLSIVLEVLKDTDFEDEILQLSSYRRLLHQARREIDPQEIRRLYSSNDPKVLAALAENMHTPDELLHEFSRLQSTFMAKHIRSAAVATLQRKKTVNNQP